VRERRRVREKQGEREREGEGNLYHGYILEHSET